MLCASGAPLDRLQAYKRRMGWGFPWVSSGRSDFNYDYGVSVPGLDPGAYQPEMERPGRIVRTVTVQRHQEAVRR